MYSRVPIEELFPDENNPRTTDPNRLHMLCLSLSKLGFILPVAALRNGMVLSGHQRLLAAQRLGWAEVPVQYIDLPEKDITGINILFNRATNDFGALDSGADALQSLHISDVLHRAESLADWEGDIWYAEAAEEQPIKGMGQDIAHLYDKKAVVVANNFIRKGIRIPIVVSSNGGVVNGVYRLFAARENGISTWPVVTIDEDHADFATHFLNFLSMDFHVDEEFADMLRYSAYRRPQNNRGSVPKAYRFWANGLRTTLERNSYTPQYWRKFRDIHGMNVLDFGAGLCKVSPFLETKGISCAEFEPYRIDPKSGVGKPDPDFSKLKAKEFLDHVSDPNNKFDSIFMASVLNSIPFPKDRMAVLAVVHALSSFNTTVFGTCRDISDFHYEYGGIRQANYFVFDSEQGVRLGDSLANPKIQKFHTTEEVAKQFSYFWNTSDFWPGGNVFYWRCSHPKRCNTKVLSQAIELEFNLPYADGTTMGLVDHAKKCFSNRLGVKVK